MKKLSLLVALILCVTVGSVYATWFYAEQTMQTATHEFKNLGITDVNTSAQTGRIAVTDTLILKIDDNDDSHHPAWDTDVTAANGGLIQIAFTPNSGASTTTFNYTVTIVNNEYDGQKIFNNDATVLAGSFVHTAGTTMTTKDLTFGEITTALKVNSDIELQTLAEYNAYRDALNDVELVLTIEEQTANP